MASYERLVPCSDLPSPKLDGACRPCNVVVEAVCPISGYARSKTRLKNSPGGRLWFNRLGLHARHSPCFPDGDNTLSHNGEMPRQPRRLLQGARDSRCDNIIVLGCVVSFVLSFTSHVGLHLRAPYKKPSSLSIYFFFLALDAETYIL